ncbi:MAG: 4-hydroxy-tetrahydrodipicolinate reductase [Crocinitomicaceae bacterium]|nr:4-hydroxy-tetrahydrodipicolinate reductase [Crocinitomicaceae bacterium]
MKIALIGYGKMGKAIEKLAMAKGHQITAIVDSQNSIENTNFDDVDVAIEFTRPELAVKHMNFCLEIGLPIVVGTTAWQNELKIITENVSKYNGALVHASNFSIGVNLFFEMNKKLAKIMEAHPAYKLEMTEIHHTQKLDKPSGTAVTLAEGIIEQNTNYKNWRLAESNELENGNEFFIHALREENVPGTHLVNYSSPIDSIQIQHIAHTRDGFALGAILAAEWIKNKKGIFTMKDVLQN